nr:uncharacterized protein LOC118096919 isoform X4 [Zootoca vivipara]
MWLCLKCSHQSHSVKEWEDFILTLSDAVQQQMAESHINALQDLSEAAKGFVLEKAVSAIQGGDAYKALMSQVSGCLEEQIYCQIAREIQDGDRRVKNKPALLLNHLKDGVMTLLEERPELRGRLCSLFNQPLPADLRHLTWKLYLSNTKARLGYLSHLAANRATSRKDREISLRCRALLDSEPTFQSLRNHKASGHLRTSARPRLFPTRSSPASYSGFWFFHQLCGVCFCPPS